jgi:hypothetical protein
MKREQTFPVLVRLTKKEYEALKDVANAEKRSMGSQAVILIRGALNGAK